MTDYDAERKDCEEQINRLQEKIEQSWLEQEAEAKTTELTVTRRREKNQWYGGFDYIYDDIETPMLCPICKKSRARIEKEYRNVLVDVDGKPTWLKRQVAVYILSYDIRGNRRIMCRNCVEDVAATKKAERDWEGGC